MTQKEIEHADREQRADDARFAHVAQRILDGFGLIVDDKDRDALQLRLGSRVFDHFEYAFHGVNDVGLRRLEYVDANRGSAIKVASQREFRADQFDVGEILQSHIRLNDEIANLLERGQFADGSHSETLAAICQLSGTDGEIAALENFDEALHVDAVCRDAARVDQDAYLAWLDTGKVDTRDAIESLDRLFEEMFEDFILRRQVLGSRQSYRQHRLISGGGREHQYATGGLRQLRANRIKLGAHTK